MSRQHREIVVLDGSPAESRPAHRPPIFGVPLTRTIKFRVTDEQYRDLQSVAAQEDLDASTIVRDAVDCYVGDFRERRMFFVNKRGYQPE